MNLDVLDQVPQIPGGPWVNHAFYGTLLGLAAAAAIHIVLHEPAPRAWALAALMVFLLAAAKKTFDYTTRGPAQGETLASCIGKALVTPAFTTMIAWTLQS